MHWQKIETLNKYQSWCCKIQIISYKGYVGRSSRNVTDGFNAQSVQNILRPTLKKLRNAG